MKIEENVSLKPLTTFKVGGPARYYVRAQAPAEIGEAVDFAEERKIPFYILGGGSNVVFADRGYPGIVIHISDGGIAVEGEKIFAGAGVPLETVVKKAAEHHLAGLERLAGIPGSFGGGVRGNAGAFGAEISNFITTVKVFDKKSGMVREFSREQCRFTYRSSLFKADPTLVILSAELRLKPGHRAELEQIMLETKDKREKKHPQDACCAGSFFMNPVVKNEKLRKEFELDNGVPPKDDKLPAGWLIDHVGLRGKTIGGAMVSHLHPNYVVNTGEATAEDIVMLASLVKMRVRDELGVQLKEEVQYVGF